MRIAFLGPEGTFTEEALLASMEEAVDPVFDPVPMSTNYGAVLAVQEQQVDRAFVPIENSLEGSVSDTLDALVFDAPDVSIAREVTHSIRHNLITKHVLQFNEIECLVSHPHATAQCRRFIHKYLSTVEIIASNSTAEAVEMVAESKQPWAALGTELSATIYGCTILQAGVEDSADNQTRFVYLDRSSAPTTVATSASQKTSIVCGIGKDRPGALLEILAEFASRGINLTKIESRPAKTALGAYLFFIDAQLTRDNELGMHDALGTLATRLESLRILGTYPFTPDPSHP